MNPRRTVPDEPWRMPSLSCRCCGQQSIRANRQPDQLCLSCFDRPEGGFYINRGYKGKKGGTRHFCERAD